MASHPDSETGNLRKAEEYGLETVRETDFWSALGLNLTPALDGPLGHRGPLGERRGAPGTVRSLTSEGVCARHWDQAPDAQG